jgi:hypothetical protein
VICLSLLSGKAYPLSCASDLRVSALLTQLQALDQTPLPLQLVFCWPSTEAPDFVLDESAYLLAAVAWTELEEPLYVAFGPQLRKSQVAPLEDPFG